MGRVKKFFIMYMMSLTLCGCIRGVSDTGQSVEQQKPEEQSSVELPEETDPVSMGGSSDEETDTVAAQTEKTQAEEAQTEENPINTVKEILYYLMWTSDEKLKNDVTAMKTELELSSDDIETMRQIGLKQYQANEEADKQFQKDGDVEKFNETAHLNADCAREELQQLLGDKYEVFLEWIAVWWEEEREYRESKW